MHSYIFILVISVLLKEGVTVDQLAQHSGMESNHAPSSSDNARAASILTTPPFKCPGIGNYPKSGSCKEFYRCERQKSSTSEGYEMLLMSCPVGTAFVPPSGSCISISSESLSLPNCTAFKSWSQEDSSDTLKSHEESFELAGNHSGGFLGHSRTRREVPLVTTSNKSHRSSSPDETGYDAEAVHTCTEDDKITLNNMVHLVIKWMELQNSVSVSDEYSCDHRLYIFEDFSNRFQNINKELVKQISDRNNISKLLTHALKISKEFQHDFVREFVIKSHRLRSCIIDNEDKIWKIHSLEAEIADLESEKTKLSEILHKMEIDVVKRKLEHQIRRISSKINEIRVTIDEASPVIRCFGELKDALDFVKIGVSEIQSVFTHIQKQVQAASEEGISIGLTIERFINIMRSSNTVINTEILSSLKTEEQKRKKSDMALRHVFDDAVDVLVDMINLAGKYEEKVDRKDARHFVYNDLSEFENYWKRVYLRIRAFAECGEF